MRLKRLEISGFKSFYDKCRLDFPKGITAIVGPNGCGKSNIVDAMRWVMGEQSVKQLRGKAMEDVIFSGTNGAAPLNLAEVNLTLVNDNGSAPEELRDFSEIMLTRRLYRSGESRYYLNKQPCRLKDIRNVFLGSGMGTRSYTMIQQGNIGAITEAGPEDRRHFIEEAAGTTRFKARRVEALNKVKATRRNLLRLDDLMVEIKRQMGSLKRQAGKARRYKKFRALARAIDIRLNLLRYDDHAQKIDETEKMLEKLRDTEGSQTALIKKIDAAIAEIKFKRQQKNQQLADDKSKRSELQRTLDRNENTRANLLQEADRLTGEISELESAKTSLEQRNNQIRTEIEQARTEIGRLEEKIGTLEETIQAERAATVSTRQGLETLNEDLERAKAELMELIAQETRYKNIYQHASSNKESLRHKLKLKAEEEQAAIEENDRCRANEAAARERLASLRGRLADLETEIEAVQQELGIKTEELSLQIRAVRTLEQSRNEIASRHAALKKMEDNFEWYREGVRAIMQLKPSKISENKKSAASREKAPPQLAEEIIELMADVISPAVSYEAAVEAVLGDALQYVLVSNRETGLMAIDYLKNIQSGRSGFLPVNSLPVQAEEMGPKSSSSRSLLNHVTVKKGFEPVAQLLLGDVDVAEDLPLALEAYNQNEPRRTIVTRSGDMISRQGVLIGGGNKKLGGILAKKQELKLLGKQLAKIDQEIESARDAQAATESQVKTAEIRLQKLTVARNEIVQDEIEAEKDLFKAGESLKNANHRLEIIQLEQEQLLGEATDIEEEISRYDQALAGITDKVEASQEMVSCTNARIQSMAEQMEKISRREMDLKLELTSFKAQRDNYDNSIRRLREFLSDQENRYSQLVRDIEGKINKKNRARENAEKIKQSLAAMYHELEQADAKIDAGEKDYQAFDTYLTENENRIASTRDHHEKIMKETRLLEVELSELTITQKNISDRLHERYHKTISGLRQEMEEAATEKQTAAFQNLDVEELTSKLNDLERKISVLGDVNMGAISEYQTLETRYTFLTEQREDLVKAIDGLSRVISKINRLTQKRFIETLELINEKLTTVFSKLFEGGTAKLVLTEPEKPLESGVEFLIQPPGKKLTRMSLLSGGEKALSAIAFIFSIFLIRPASFCFLDEIDAPLDESNVLRFNNLIQSIGKNSQIIMITHNKKSMEFAETLFGITMPQKGVSKIVSVNFTQAAA
ncbi:MAG: chromosome segregation protein SMC [Deltaproteobacteria bacterium]|nr:MAG: chromosome segregation protein SMC [Deltaproteobacteria bacterium]